MITNEHSLIIDQANFFHDIESTPFPTYQRAMDSLKSKAESLGFRLFIRYQRKNMGQLYCESGRQPSAATTVSRRECCPFSVKISFDADKAAFMVVVLNSTHTHEMRPVNAIMAANVTLKQRVAEMKLRGMTSNQVMQVLIDERYSFLSFRDISRLGPKIL